MSDCDMQDGARLRVRHPRYNRPRWERSERRGAVALQLAGERVDSAPGDKPCAATAWGS